MDLDVIALRVLWVILAAGVGEAFIEFLPAKILSLVWPNTDEFKDRRAVVLDSLSALLGVGIALNFNLGLFSLVGAFGAYAWIDLVLTGALIGRGSTYMHEFIKKFILKKE